MRPDTSEWRDSRSYDYFDALETEGLAWECLRRSQPYQKHYASLVAEKLETMHLSPEAEQRWGLRFPRKTQPYNTISGRSLVHKRQHSDPRAHAPARIPVTFIIYTAHRRWRSTP